MTEAKTFFGKQLWRLIQERCNGVQRRFAQLLGVSPTSVNNWLSGNVPSFDVISQICSKTGCSAQWFLTGDGDPFEKPQATPEQSALENIRILHDQVAEMEMEIKELRRRLEARPDRYIESGIGSLDLSQYCLVPLYESGIAASENGAGIHIDENVRSHPAVLYRGLVDDPATVVAVRIVGRSMEPELRDRGIAFFDLSKRDERLCRNKIVAAVTDPRKSAWGESECVVKRLFYRPASDCYVLSSINEEYRDGDIEIPRAWGWPVLGLLIGAWNPAE